MTFAELLSTISKYSDVTDDSREVRPGAIFVAVHGSAETRARHVEQAVKSGATVIVSEAEHGGEGKADLVRVPDCAEALAALVAVYHGDPSRGLCLIGVTGTCGKTTTTFLIESILSAAGRKTGLMGTVCYRYPGFTATSNLTTPGVTTVQKMLADMRGAGCAAAVMEVSSHALTQRRVKGLLFDVIVFLNLSLEHLDYHGTMEDYFETKTLLFTEYADAAISAGKKPIAIVNVNDKYGRRLAELIHSRRSPDLCLITVDLTLPASTCGEPLRYDVDGISGSIQGTPFKSRLVGGFNGENILAAITVGQALAVGPGALAAGIDRMTAVPGRLERVIGPRNVRAFVDFAHKPHALTVVLDTILSMKGDRRLIVVFGCGGDRDKAKRPVMGAIAMERADHVWITNDNPRTEAPDNIVQDILRGVVDKRRVTVELDRERAIRGAIGMAEDGDFVIVAGKGPETYQIIAAPDRPEGVRKIHMDDREIVAKALAGK